MSSILDALNKLEGEKERERAQQTLEPFDIDPESAAEALIEPDALRDSVTLNIRPVTLIAGAVSLLVLIVVIVAITVSVMVDPEPQQVATAVPAILGATSSQQESPAPDTTVTANLSPPEVAAAIPEAIPEQPPVAEPEVMAEPVAAIPEETTEPEPAQAKQPDPTPVSEPVEPEVLEAVPEPVVPEPVKPEPLVVAQATSPGTATASSPRTESVPKPVEAELINIQALPRFTVTLQRKHGLDDFKINMINPISDTNPYGNAIINRAKVFENSYIGGNQVLLKKVQKDGVAVEVVRTGEIFFHGF